MERDLDNASAAAGVRNAAVIVAHPDDETLWAGGTILMHPAWRWTVGTCCRASDPDRSVKFFAAMDHLGAAGALADLDDGPEQTPVDAKAVGETILSLLPDGPIDLLITHSPLGEYTRHRRHEEVGGAVLRLWRQGRLPARRIWLFAYDDQAGRRTPQADENAHRLVTLPEEVWRAKYRLITEIYGFGADGFEARTAPRREGFWCFASPASAEAWMRGQVIPT